MFRVSKLTDYGFLILNKLGEAPELAKNSSQIAEELGLKQPTTAKLLKILNAKKIVSSQRGCNGGYTLAKPISEITLYDVITTIEGDIGLTDCTFANKGELCVVNKTCALKHSWVTINDFILGVMKKLTLEDMSGNISDKLNKLNEQMQ